MLLLLMLLEQSEVLLVLCCHRLEKIHLAYFQPVFPLSCKSDHFSTLCRVVVWRPFTPELAPGSSADGKRAFEQRVTLHT